MMHEQNKWKLLTGGSMSLMGLLLLSWYFTDPDSLGPFGITVWFGMLLLALTGLLIVGRYKITRLLHRPILKGKIVRQSVLLATWAIALLALNSLRQLDAKDIVLVSILIGLSEVYLRKV